MSLWRLYCYYAQVAVKGGASHRKRQAEATKEAIAGAARTLFRERGYAATTMKSISEAAAIPEQTIYSSLGSKAQILGKITELWMRDSRTTEIASAYFQEPEPEERLRMFVALQRQQLDLGADIIAIYREAARTDERMANLFAGILAAREAEIGKLLQSLETSLRPGLSVPTALDVTIALTLDEVYSVLRQRGWDSDRYESWLAETLVDRLLGCTE